MRIIARFQKSFLLTTAWWAIAALVACQSKVSRVETLSDAESDQGVRVQAGERVFKAPNLVTCNGDRSWTNPFGVVRRDLPFDPTRIPSSAREMLLPAWLSILSYKNGGEIHRNLKALDPGFTRKGVMVYDDFEEKKLSGTGVQVFVAQSSAGRFVVFRGSSGLHDWMQNFDIEPRALPRALLDPSAQGTDAAELRVHSGFVEQFESSWPHVLKALKGADESLHDEPVWVIGHSLGGAIAALTAYAIALQEPTTPAFKLGALVTLAQPRFANEAFVERFNERMGGRYVRMVVPEDPVPYTPASAYSPEAAAQLMAFVPKPDAVSSLEEGFRIWKYAHAGNRCELHRDGTLRYTPQWTDREGDQNFYAGSGPLATALRAEPADSGPGSLTAAFNRFKRLLGLPDHRPEPMMCSLLESVR